MCTATAQLKCDKFYFVRDNKTILSASHNKSIKYAEVDGSSIL